MMIMDDVVVADDSVAVGAAKKKTSPETRNSTFRYMLLLLDVPSFIPLFKLL
ncbi:hypothetical protein HanPI659440_Chr15g0616401 [Helianthus annuus]|nr:hypothetical protein HanPI659440_Chr15g0616401 [Helianthus annuus]